MDIEILKKEFKKMRAPKMDISIDFENNFNDFFQLIRKQDKEDEKYILHNKMIPTLLGLFSLIIIVLFNPVKTALLLTGFFLIFVGLFSMLILMFLEYKKISKESYDFSLLSYLKQKKERLESWRATSIKFYITFLIFVVGLMMNNIYLLRHYSPEAGILWLTVYLALLVIAWIVGEYFYRKRHKKKHQPLIKFLSEQIEKLRKE